MVAIVRASRCLLLIGLALLTGCQTGWSWRRSSTDVSPTQLIRVTGPYRHAPSGMEFPPSVGEFNRATLLQHDKAGLSVSARYDIDGATSKIIATVFVYPGAVGTPASRPELCNRQLEAATVDVTSFYRGARPAGLDDVTLDQEGIIHHARHATFLYDEPMADETLPRAAQLFLFCNAADKWQVKYVVTYPRELNIAPIMDDFMKRLTWTLNPG
jgi:hypothetical protein